MSDPNEKEKLSHSIHVNPKFLLSRALTISPQEASTVSGYQSPTLPMSTMTAVGLESLIDIDCPADITETQMREQLLMKRKELLELQTKKVELELLQTKVQLEEQTRKQIDGIYSKQKHLLHHQHADKLRHTSILLNDGKLITSPPRIIATLSRTPDKNFDTILDSDSSHSSSSELISRHSRRKRRSDGTISSSDTDSRSPVENSPQKIARDRSVNFLNGVFGPGDVDCRKTKPSESQAVKRRAKTKGNMNSSNGRDRDERFIRFDGSGGERTIQWKRSKLDNNKPVDEDFRIGVFNHNNRPKETLPLSHPPAPNIISGSINSSPNAIQNLSSDSFVPINNNNNNNNLHHEIRTGTVIRGPWTGPNTDLVTRKIWDKQPQQPCPVPNPNAPWNPPPQPVVTNSWNFCQQQQQQQQQPLPPQFHGANQFNPALIMPQKFDILPQVSIIELDSLNKDTTGLIPIDNIQRQVRFYGNLAIVLLGEVGDEPRELSFEKTETKIVQINHDDRIECVIGETVPFFLNGKRHDLKLGAPTRELNIDGDHFEAFFNGPPVKVCLDGYFHVFKLLGIPPRVTIGKTIRHDLLAGIVNLDIDGTPIKIYIDEKPQRFDLSGFPVILRFCDGFRTVLLNGRPYPTNFGALPISVTLPSGRKHYLRFPRINDVTRMAMLEFIRVREQKGGDNSGPMSDIPPFGAPFHGRGPGMMGIRGAPGVPRLPGSNLPHTSDSLHPSSSSSSLTGFEQPSSLGVLTTVIPEPVPTDRGVRRSLENSYESDRSYTNVNEMGVIKRSEVDNLSTDIKNQSHDGCDKNSISNPFLANSSSSLNVQDLLSKLRMAGLLPTSTDEKKDGKVEEEECTTEPCNIKQASKVEKNNKTKETVILPLEIVDIHFDKLKERREKLIATISTGVQCGSCGLRFPPDQIVRYSEHLDWHFRQNRREKANVKKVLSRKWYYDIPDWKQFQEIEDLDERALSFFESQNFDKDKTSGMVLNPNLYTVLSAGHEGAKCPQCNEGFETFYDEEKEEWRLRYAHLAECIVDNVMKLYHPICHKDFVACVLGKSFLNSPLSEDEIMETTGTDVKQEEEDEVLILKEGKPEVVIMELVEGETVEEISMNAENQETVSSITKNEIELHDESTIIIIIEKDSVKQNETICINDDDNDDANITDKNINNDVVEINNKIETETDLSNSDSSSISHTTTTTTVKNISSITDNSNNNNNNNNDTNIITQSGDTPTSNNNNNNMSSNISVNVLSPTLVDLVDDGEGGALSSIPLITNINNIALNLSQNSKSTKIESYLPMKFDVPTPIIKEESIDPDEIPSGHVSLDEMIKTNMTDEVQDGMELGEGEPTNLIPETVDLDASTPQTTKSITDIDLTVDDNEDSMMEALATLDGNILLESTAPTTQTSKLKTGFRIHIQDAIVSTDSMDSIGKKSPLPDGGGGERTDESSVNPTIPNSQILPKDSQQIKTSDEKDTNTPTQKDDTTSSNVSTSEKLELSTDSSRINVNKNIITPTTTTTNSSSTLNINTTTTTVQQQIESTAVVKETSDIVNNNTVVDVPKKSKISKPNLIKLKPRLKGRKFVNVPPKSMGTEISGLCTIC